MSEVVYEVLTEFVFDTREAITNSEALRGAVDKISGAADGALFSLNRLAQFASTGLGLNLSVMGAMGAALSQFEKFSKTRLTFANLIGANMENLTGNVETFNDRLQVSENIMRNIAGVAREYSLDEASMVNTTKMLAALLTPMGLSGKNMGGAVNMARMFEKSAPILGIDTGQAQGELVRLLSGQASMGDTLFRRLVSDTKPFQPYRSMMQNPMMMHHMGGGPAQIFNMLPMQKRWEMINKAMAQFSSDADVVAGNANLLSAKLMALKNELIGIDGVLRPIGEELTSRIRPILTQAMTFLEQYARPALVKFGGALHTAFENPDRIYASLRQVQQLRTDLPKAVSLMHAFDSILFAAWIVRLPMVRPIVAAIGQSLLRTGSAFAFLGIRALGLTGSLLSIGNVFRIVWAAARFGFGLISFVMTRFVAPLAIFLGLLQILSRAKGYAEALDAQQVMKNGKMIGQTMVDLGKSIYDIVAPVDQVVDNMARSIAPFFQYATYLGFIADNSKSVNSALGSTGTFVLYAAAGFTALGAVVRQVLIVNVTESFSEFFSNIHTLVIDWGGKIVTRLHDVLDNLFSGNFGAAKDLAGQPLGLGALQTNPNVMAFPEIGELFKQTAFGFIDDFQKNLKDPNNKDKAVSNLVTNIGSVNIRQDFKENMEPDRIAHSFVQVIKGLAINPTQATRRSFSGALTR